MKRPFSAVALALATAVAQPSWSATHLIEQQVDAAYVASHGYSEFQWFAEPVTVAEGDHVSLVFNFLPGQRLEIVNPAELWGNLSMLNQGPGRIAYFDMSMSFIGLDGPAHDVAASASDTGGWGVLAVFRANQFMNTPGPASISFSGLRFDISITGYSDGISTRTYDSAMVIVFGGDHVSAVPEPAASTMTLLGLAAILGVARRRTRNV